MIVTVALRPSWQFNDVVRAVGSSVRAGLILGCECYPMLADCLGAGRMARLLMHFNFEPEPLTSPELRLDVPGIPSSWDTRGSGHNRLFVYCWLAGGYCNWEAHSEAGADGYARRSELAFARIAESVALEPTLTVAELIARALQEFGSGYDDELKITGAEDGSARWAS
jgi:hypothetical protein